MSTKLRTVLVLVTAGLVGYSCSPDPSAFSVTTHVAGWTGVVGLLMLLGTAPKDQVDDEDEDEVSGEKA